jgi:hypothetical protein
MAAQSRHEMCSNSGIVGSNPTRDIDVCVSVVCVGSRLATR